jgi:hypothetical protein
MGGMAHFNLWGSLENYKKLKGSGKSLGRIFEVFKSDTAFPAFNQAFRRLHGRENVSNEVFSRSMKHAKAQFAKDLPKDVRLDILTELERTSLRGIQETLNKFKGGEKALKIKVRGDQILKRELTKDARNLAAQEPADIARRKRLTDAGVMDQTNELISFFNKQNLDKIEEFNRKNIPFVEFNPTAQDWVNGYMMSRYSREWIIAEKTTEDIAQEILQYSTRSRMKVDAKQLKRKMRGSKEAINRESKKTFKIFGKDFDKPIPMLETDFVKLHNTRLREMEQVIIQHDFLDDLKPLVKFEEGPGLVRLRTENWNSVIGEGADSWSPAKYVPDWMKTKQGKVRNDIYLPFEVAYRTDRAINPRQLNGFAAMAYKTWQGLMSLFRNTTLIGTGYLGQNLFGNGITGAYAGARLTGAKTIVTKMNPFVKSDKRVILNGGKFNKTSEQTWDLAQEMGVLKTSLVDELDVDLLARNAATVMDHHKSKLVTVADWSAFFAANRFFARIGDDMPKLAFWLDKIDEGYTPLAAAEATDYWFFNFQNVSSGQKVIREGLPFSTFAVKTVEREIDLIKNLDLGKLVLPVRVRDALQGLYVPDEQTVEFLNDQMPEYRQVWHPVHGPRLPGMHQIKFDIPFAKSTLGMLVAPNIERHPVFKALDLLGLTANNRTFSNTLAKEEFDSRVGSVLDIIMPPAWKHAMAMYELSGEGDVPFYNFKKTYAPRVPRTTGGSSLTITEEKFNNSNQFAEWMAKTYGDNWFFKAFFWGVEFDNIEKKIPDEEINRKFQNSTIANFMAGYFRDFSLGMARIERLDNNVLINLAAIKKSKRDLEVRIRDLSGDVLGGITSMKRYLDDPDVSLDKKAKRARELLENTQGQKRQLIEEYIALGEAEDILTQYYGVFKFNEAKNPGFAESIFNPQQERTNNGALPTYKSSKTKVPDDIENWLDSISINDSISPGETPIPEEDGL